MPSYCVSQRMSDTKVIQLKVRAERIGGQLKTCLEVFGSMTTGI
ncbi:MAG: hypothetical protein V7K32_01285 [Nostoc sp.]